MGLGNSYYAPGDFLNSENAFREIIRLQPRASAAYNNLAQILMEQGRYTEALEMAHKDVWDGFIAQGVISFVISQKEKHRYIPVCPLTIKLKIRSRRHL